MVYWITGRKGSGKTTLAEGIARDLRMKGRPVLILDGDDVRRRILDPGYSDEGRIRNMDMVAKIAGLAEDQGITVIVAMVSPVAAWRKEAMKSFQCGKLIYLEGGTLWEGSRYEEPGDDEPHERRKPFH